ncbi:MAG: hypothetical protein ACYTAF_07190 [Planctomycetota bacterium]|jgi:hypothetical protein
MQTRVTGKDVNSGTTLVNDNGTFDDVPGLESICEGISVKALGSLAIARQGRFLYWGFTSDPSGMTDFGKKVFLNAVRYLYSKRCTLTTEYVCKPRGNLVNYHRLAVKLERYRKKAMTHFSNSVAPEIIEDWQPTVETVGAWLEENLPYLRFNGMVGHYHTFDIDRDAKSLGTPNSELKSLAKWVELAEGKESGERTRALACLERYVDPAIRPKDGKWGAWFETMESRLVFVDTAGFRFVEDPRILEKEAGPHHLLVTADVEKGTVTVANYGPMDVRLTEIRAGEVRRSMEESVPSGGRITVARKGGDLRLSFVSKDGVEFTVDWQAGF